MIMVNLEFDKTIPAVSGSDYGEKIFNEQVKDKINYNDINVIQFPENINIIGISFVQGFTKQILSKIPLMDFDKYFQIQGNDRAVKKFYKSLYF